MSKLEIKNLNGEIKYETAYIEAALDDPEHYDLEGYYDKLNIRGIDYTMYEEIEKTITNKKNMIQDKLIDDMKKYLDNN